MPKAKSEPWILLGVPVGGAKRLMMEVNRRVARFEQSRHAASLEPQVAQVALHSLLVWQGTLCSRIDRWADFDASEYAAWLTAQSLLHPAVVPELYRAWRCSLEWLVEEGVVAAREAESIFEDLCDLENALVHLVIDAYLTFREQVGRAARDVPLAS